MLLLPYHAPLAAETADAAYAFTLSVTIVDAILAYALHYVRFACVLLFFFFLFFKSYFYECHGILCTKFNIPWQIAIAKEKLQCATKIAYE